MHTLGVIPARLHSTRLPGKLLLAETGLPLLEHTWRAARSASSLDELVVATDSPEIAAAVRSFGGSVEMTGTHSCGTDRIAEVARRRADCDALVNVQGDEPEIDPAAIDRLVDTLAADPDCPMATLAAPFEPDADVDDPAAVKVVTAEDGRALYFSRAAIPFVRDAGAVGAGEEDAGEEDAGALLHLGVYAYRRAFLIRLAALPPSRLERLEKLEQLRALEAGATVRVGVVRHRAVGIDTPADYARFVTRWRARHPVARAA